MVDNTHETYVGAVPHSSPGRHRPLRHPWHSLAARATYRRCALQTQNVLAVLEETADRLERARLLHELSWLESRLAESVTRGWGEQPIDDQGGTRADGHRVAAELLARLAAAEINAAGSSGTAADPDKDSELRVLVNATVARTRAALVSRRWSASEASAIAGGVESQHFAYTLLGLSMLNARATPVSAAKLP